MDKFEEILITKSLSIATALLLSYFKDAIFFKPFPHINLVNILILFSIVPVLLDVKLITEVVIENWIIGRMILLIFECLFYTELGLIFIWPKIAELIGSMKGARILSIFSKVVKLSPGTVIVSLKYATAVFIFACVLQSSTLYKMCVSKIKVKYFGRKEQERKYEQPCHCPALSNIRMKLQEMESVCESSKYTKRKTNESSAKHD